MNPLLPAVRQRSEIVVAGDDLGPFKDDQFFPELLWE